MTKFVARIAKICSVAAISICMHAGFVSLLNILDFCLVRRENSRRDAKPQRFAKFSSSFAARDRRRQYSNRLFACICVAAFLRALLPSLVSARSAWEQYPLGAERSSPADESCVICWFISVCWRSPWNCIFPTRGKEMAQPRTHALIICNRMLRPSNTPTTSDHLL